MTPPILFFSFLMNIILCSFLFLFSCISLPERGSYDIPEAYDRAICLYYTQDRAFSKNSRNALECEKETMSLMEARKEMRAKAQIETCLTYKEKGFASQRECLYFIDKK